MAAQYYNVEIRVSNGLNYDDVIRPKTITQNITDLLDNNKIKLSWLPIAALGNHSSVGTIVAAKNTSDLLLTLDTWLTNIGYDKQNHEDDFRLARSGKYFSVFAESIIITCGDDHRIYYSEQGGIIEPSGTVTLENGDRLEYSHYNDGIGCHVWGIVNNTYADATATEKGVVKLAVESEIKAGTDTTKAVTPAGAKKAASEHHPNSNVAAGTYKSVTVDSRGHVTAGSNPTTLAGYGITDAAPASHVTSRGNAHSDATPSESGFMSSADKNKLDGIASGANNYTHPTYTQKSLDLGTNETIDALTVDGTGHVTAATKQTIRAGTENLDGLLQLATEAEAKQGMLQLKAISPLRVRNLLSVFGPMIPMGNILPDMTTEANRALNPAGKLFLYTG
ncbi:MAG TPA: hypothetical protein PLR16_05030 [Bacilli bacterium]|nr:MAG: hypothetical protein BWY97_00090 [Tenericutes bacterium ADurb.BinA124]HPX84623.1 hypothetical protein [Bacilli bacterium]